MAKRIYFGRVGRPSMSEEGTIQLPPTRLPADIAERVRALADRLDRSLADCTREAYMLWLEKHGG